MARRTAWVMALLMLLVGSVAQAAGWERLWQRLESWEGARTVLLGTNLTEPYGSQIYRRLIAGLLDRGFTVVPANAGRTAVSGLAAELRQTSGGIVVVVSRVRDGALLATQRLAAGPAVPDTAAPPGTAAARPTRSPPRRFELQGHPVRVAVLPGGHGLDLDLALLYDERLEWLALRGNHLIRRARVPSKIKSSRGLYLGAGPLDDDAAAELAVVWVQDRNLGRKGTNSLLVARIVEARAGELRPESPDFHAYLRVLADRAFAQRRSEHQAYDGPVLRLRRGAAGFELGDPVPGWGDDWLYAVTPLGPEYAVAWIEPGRLSLIRRETGERVSQVALPGLGKVTYPQVAVRLEQPRIVTGMDLVERDQEDYVSVPRRVLVGQNGAIYTVARSRTSPLFGLLASQSQDRLVRLVRTDHGLQETEPVIAVEAFILDFDLFDTPAGTGAVLLVNEEADGSGQASLVIEAPGG